MKASSASLRAYDGDDAGGELPPAPTVSVRAEWGDIVVALAILCMAAWFFVTAGTLEDYSGEGIGAADFPTGIAALLGIGTLIIISAALRRLVGGGTRGGITVRRYVHVALGMLLLVAFPYLMEHFGYYSAMGVWLAAFLVLCDVRRPIPIILYVGGFLLFTKLVFEILLGTPLS
ncbi:tripartite tricarboxylate transporter TctB family protein [Aureimonas frigidaquae]|uniref:DUF1468 domain-containing protein n=1 Tax=Aureimonas frigidaquae TaxID=424757 RepID=A0A0P0Z0G8_9HYPH|nr:tripartite tricarboxylate transporter TctB family protein [Aureimonas frigidaquae]BAT27389.1 hypothetical protein [Aureimonas frigidaquae]